jgi:predicted ribosomally synthesized peptide with nif11-like leader
MSKANAKAFLQRLMESKELVERCRAGDEDERLRIAAALGFPHTTQEMQAVIDEGIQRAKRRVGDLSERELETISGGQGEVTVVVIALAILDISSTDGTLPGPVEIDL